MSRLSWVAVGLLTWAVAGCRGPGIADGKSNASLLAYVTQFNTNEVAVVDAVTKTPAGPNIQVGAGPMRMVVNPTKAQEFLYVLNQTGGTVTFVNRRSSRAEVDVSAGRRPEDIAISPDGKYLFVTNPDAGTITRINVESRIADQTLALGAGFRPQGIAVNSNCKREDAARCAEVKVFVVNENVTTQTGSQGNVTKVGGVMVLTSQKSGMALGTVIPLNGAERPWKAAVDATGRHPYVYITDTQLANGLFRINMESPSQAEPWGTGAVGLTYDAEVDPNGVVYASVPTRNQYAQIKFDQTVLHFPDQGKIRDTSPRALAFTSDQGELWIGFHGSSTIAYATIQAGKPLELRPVTYSLLSNATQPPEDIVLAGGI